MTDMLDPWEISAEDAPETVAFQRSLKEGLDFDLGEACGLDGEECEACQ